jgi:CHAD domain-containing protein
MASEGKWVTGISPSTNAEDAAKIVLSARLGMVKHYLPLAGTQAHEDIEYVHQLRVATRRSGAALRIFKPYLARKPLRHAKKSLRDVRQAAGAARDWDVFAEYLSTSKAFKAAGTEASLDFLTGYALGERAAAQVTLTATAEALQPKIDEVCEALPDSAGPPKEEESPRTFGELAVNHLTTLFDGFAVFIAAKPTTPDQLHQLRILAKRVRYAMEVFAECFTPPFREVLYPAVERVQGILGTVQDGNVGLTRIGGIRSRVKATRPETAKRVQKGLLAVERELRQSVRAKTREFEEWIEEWTKLTDEHTLEELLHTAEAGL